MFHSFLASSFTDAARAQQFAAVRAALLADAAPPTLLLGNLVLEDGAAPLDAVVVRPHSITLLVLVPGTGRLGIPALGYGSWLLDGAALPGAEEFDNPFEQFRAQKQALEAWLRPRFTPGQANLSFISGLVLFGAHVTFGPDVEAALNDAPAGFQLLSQPADLPRRLRQLAKPEIDLTPNDLAEWADEWAAFAAATPGPAAPATGAAAVAPAAASTFLGQKARALWGWLGANDVPDDDPPYGYAATLSARNEEKEQLEQLRQQMQADLNNQLSALEAREAERERNIAQLRSELAQAPPVAAEATALVSRLGAETREKAALEAEMQASRDELAARNQELDAKIQQLGQLIEQLNKAAIPATPVAMPMAPALPPPAQETATAVSNVSPDAVGAPVPEVSIVAAAPFVPAAAPAPVGLVVEKDSEVGTLPRPKPIPSAPDTKAEAAAAPVGTATAPGLAAAANAQWAEWRKRATGLGAQLTPRLRQAGEWGRTRPKAALAMAGAAVLALGVWGLNHRSSTAPVPYQENGRWGYVNASGEPIIKAQFTEASPFQAGQAVVAKDGAYGLVDERGREVVAPAYDALNPYAEGFARARVGDAYTFIDEDGQEFDHYYFNALDFAEGHAAVLDYRGWHYIKGAEEPEKPVIFKEAYSFSGGLARVKLADGYTYITPAYLNDPAQGTKPFGRYQLAADFADDKARVTQNGRSFVIDKDGDEVK